MTFDKYNFQKSASPIAIDWEEIEVITAFQLPEDYKYFLENYHGYEGFIGSEFLQLWGYNDFLEKNNSYGIIDHLISTCGIGTNGSGEFLAIELIAPCQYRVVLSPFIDLSKEYHIEIGASFSEMLIQLDSGKEWFR